MSVSRIALRLEIAKDYNILPYLHFSGKPWSVLVSFSF